jgi:hypothetical protein
MSLPTPRFSLPPLSTPLRQELEAMIDRLSELRWSRVASETIHDDSPADLHALATFLKEFAVKADDVLRMVAKECGYMPLVGGYGRILSDAIEGDMLYAITERAERIESERAPRGDPNAEHSTLNRRQQGILR